MSWLALLLIVVDSSSVEADGSAASSAPGPNPVGEGEPPEAVLQPPNTAETTVSENNKSFLVTIQPPMAGRRKQRQKLG